MIKRVVTSLDVARRAGVSQATVSLVLNGVQSVKISEETRRRVLQAARELDYRPNRLAAGLRTTRSRTIGVVFPSLAVGTFYGELFQAFEEVISGTGLSLLVVISHGDGGIERKLVGLLLEHRVDGLLVIPSPSRGNVPLYQQLLQTLPIVFVDRRLPGVRADYVASDHYASGEMAFEHLYQLGHRRIAFLNGPEWPCSSLVDRLRAYETMRRKYGVGYRKVIYTRRDVHHQHACGYEAISRALREGFDATAIVAGNDKLAIGALRALREFGLRVPDDVSVVGYSDEAMASYVTPPLTTVRHHFRETGRTAARLLLARIHESFPSDPQTILIPPELVVRGSTGPLGTTERR